MSASTIEWAAAARALRGESDSGDRHLVTTWPDGALLAAVDGLGHGAEAARAADLAVRTVERYAREPLTEIVERCHRSLLRTRGVALSLARWEGKERSVTWIGVGNVEGVLLHPGSGTHANRQRLLLRGGAVGVRLPALQALKTSVPFAGLLIFATDGIAGGFDQGLDASGRPQVLADQILARHSRATDDAMVLVARLAG
jgi:hypothetical protein